MKKLVFVHFYNIRKNINKQASTKDLHIFTEIFFRNCNDRFPEKRKMYCLYTHMPVARSLLFLTTVKGVQLISEFNGKQVLMVEGLKVACVYNWMKMRVLTKNGSKGGLLINYVMQLGEGGGWLSCYARAEIAATTLIISRFRFLESDLGQMSYCGIIKVVFTIFNLHS